jgi:hypothetical protein
MADPRQYFENARAIQARRDLRCGPKALLQSLLLFNGKLGCFPSHQTLADAIGANRRAVQLWQAELISKGLLTVESGGGRKAVNRYSLNLEQLGNSAPDAPIEEQNSAPDAQFEEENSAPYSGNSARHSRNSAGGAHRTTNKNQKQRERGARPKFCKPTLAEVAAYFAELGEPDCAERFFTHFEANGWRTGRHRIADWRARAQKWVMDEPAFSRSPRGAAAGPRGSAAAEKAFDRFAAALKQFGKVRMGLVKEQFETAEWASVWKAVNEAGGSDAIIERPDAVRGRFVAAYDKGKVNSK